MEATSTSTTHSLRLLHYSDGFSASAPTQELLIALRKCNQSSRNPIPIYACRLNYHRLSTSYYAFVVSLDYASIPKTTGEAMSHPG